jgi:hypothetical protein
VAGTSPRRRFEEFDEHEGSAFALRYSEAHRRYCDVSFALKPVFDGQG